MFKYHNVMFCCSTFRDIILLRKHGSHVCSGKAVYMVWPEIEKYIENIDKNPYLEEKDDSR